MSEILKKYLNAIIYRYSFVKRKIKNKNIPAPRLRQGFGGQARGRVFHPLGAGHQGVFVRKGIGSRSSPSLRARPSESRTADTKHNSPATSPSRSVAEAMERKRQATGHSRTISNKPNNLSYDDIKIGASFSFERIIDDNAVTSFAQLTGDYSPLHSDEKYAKESGFEGRIAHGMLLGSYLSTLIGMFIPGKRALYLSQDLCFRRPLMVGKNIVVSGVVTRKSDALKIVEIKTIIKDIASKRVIISGIAKAKVRDN